MLSKTKIIMMSIAIFFGLIIYINFPIHAFPDLFAMKSIYFMQLHGHGNGMVDLPIKGENNKWIEPWAIKKTVSFINSDHKVVLLDVDNLQTKAVLPLEHVMDFRVNGRYWLAMTRDSEKTQLFTGEVLDKNNIRRDILGETQEEINSIDISSDGTKFILVSTNDNYWRLIDNNFNELTTGSGSWARFTIDNKYLVYQNETTATVLKWDTGKEILSQKAFWLVASPDRSLFAISSKTSESDVMYLWKIIEGVEVPSEQQICMSWINKNSNAFDPVAISFDNNRVAFFGNTLWWNPFGNPFTQDQIYIYNIEKNKGYTVYSNWIVTMDPQDYIKGVFFADVNKEF